MWPVCASDEKGVLVGGRSFQDFGDHLIGLHSSPLRFSVVEFQRGERLPKSGLRFTPDAIAVHAIGMWSLVVLDDPAVRFPELSYSRVCCLSNVCRAGIG